MRKVLHKKILIFALVAVFGISGGTAPFSHAAETKNDQEVQDVSAAAAETSDADEQAAEAAGKDPWTIRAEDKTLNYKEEDVFVDASTAESGSVLTYSSSDEDIAAVNADTGQLTFKKTGTVDITITAAADDEHAVTKKEVTIHLYKLNAPKILDLSNEFNGVQIVWNDTSDAKGYYIYRRTAVPKATLRAMAEEEKAQEEAAAKEAEEAAAVKNAASEETESEASTGDVQTPAEPEEETEETADTQETAASAPEPTEPTEATARATQPRKLESFNTNEWKQIKKCTSKNTIKYTDTNVENGKYYEYAVVAYNGNNMSVKKPEKIVYLSYPTVKISKVSSTKKKVSWSKNSKASGYTIQYAKHRTMISCKEKKITKRNTTSYTLTKLTENKEYYARVRAYAKVDGKTFYSVRGSTPNGTTNKKLSIKPMKYKRVNQKGKTVRSNTDVPKLAGQGMYGNSIMQGGCTDGRYGYFVLLDKQSTDRLSDDTQRIAKISLSSGKLVRLSGYLPLDHGNDMTYDSKNKRIVVVNNHGASDKASKRITFVDPSTLKSKGRKDVRMPGSIVGNSSSKIKTVAGFCAITYNKMRNKYVILTSSSHNLMILNSSFKPVKFIMIPDKYKMNNRDWYYQGMDSTNNFIMVAVSPKADNSSNYNTILMYDWHGNLKCKLSLRKGYEMENIFHVSDKWYAGFYAYQHTKKGSKRSGFIYKFSNF